MICNDKATPRAGNVRQHACGPRLARRQRGVTILETLGAIAITSLLVLGLTSMVDSSMEDLKGQQTAFHQSQVARAAERYMRVNYDTLITATTGGKVEPVTMQELKNGRFLPASFSNTNNYNQTPCVLVRQINAGAGNPPQLQALVASYGGQKIPDRILAMVALQAGEGGGYISDRDWKNARGATWNMATTNYRNIACNGTTVLRDDQANDGGRLASALFHDGSSESTADFLYRNAVNGRPELNRMNTAIRFGAAAQVAANSDCRVGGVAEPGIAIDQATKQFLFCSTAGRWTKTGGNEWKDSVEKHNQLPKNGNTRGDVRLVREIGRAFAYDGTKWVPLAADQNNDLKLRKLHTTDHIYTDKDVNVGENLIVKGNGTIRNNLFVDVDVTAKNNVIAKSGVSAEIWMYGSALQIGSFMDPGGRCHYPNGSGGIAYPVGTAVVDKNGLLMSCHADHTFRYPNGRHTP